MFDQYARREVESIGNLEEDVEEALGNIATPNVESTLNEPAEFGVLINYFGAYPVWKLPTEELSALELDDTTTGPVKSESQVHRHRLVGSFTPSARRRAGNPTPSLGFRATCRWLLKRFAARLQPGTS